MPEPPQDATPKDSFRCPACNNKYRWKPEAVGKRFQCKCGSKVTVPDKPSTARTKPSKPKPQPQPQPQDDGGIDLSALAAMEEAAGGTGPAADTPAGNWMEEATKNRAGIRSRQKADKKSRTRSSRGSDWGKFHPLSTLVFAVDLIGRFDEDGTEYSRIDHLVGYAIRCVVLLGITIFLVNLAMRQA